MTQIKTEQTNLIEQIKDIYTLTKTKNKLNSNNAIENITSAISDLKTDTEQKIKNI